MARNPIRSWALTKRSKTLTDLPVLHESAKGGCDFCRLLWDTILSEDGAADDTLRQFLVEKQQCDVELRLEYCWMLPQDCRSKSSPAPRIMILTAFLDTEYHDIDETGARSYMAFSFLMEAVKVAVSRSYTYFSD